MLTQRRKGAIELQKTFFFSAPLRICVRFDFCLCTILAIAAGGCGRARTSPVEGTVLLDGKPLAGASVQFVAQEKGRDATGETDKNGQFVMSTFKPRDGMLPGSYKVVISPPIGAVDSGKYATADEAMSGAAKASAKKDSASAFPQKYARADQTPLLQEVPVKGKLKFELTN